MNERDGSTWQRDEAVEAYEPPRAEDASTDEAPSVTAAGGTKAVGAG